MRLPFAGLKVSGRALRLLSVFIPVLAAWSVAPAAEGEDASGRCGAVALKNLLAAVQGAPADLKVLDQTPAPAGGFSLDMLAALSARAGLELAAVERPAGEPIIVPSVAHWTRGHYVAVTARERDRYRVVDGEFPGGRWMSEEALARECSGYWLVPAAQAPPSWERLNQPLAAYVKGTSLLHFPAYCDTNDPPCTNCCHGVSGCCGAGAGSGGSGSGGSGSGPGSSGSGGGTGNSGFGTGMTVWRVSEPYINLWLMDEPLGYNPGVGNRISFQLDYKQRESAAGTNAAALSCGQKWNCSWIAYVIAPSANPASGSQMIMVLPGGGQRAYIADGATPEYYSRSVMTLATNSGGAFAGCTVAYPDGSSESFNEIFTGGSVLCFRTGQTDAVGHATQFIYTQSGANILLINVIDADGRTNTLSYTNTLFPSQITGVADPFGRTATLQYDSSGLLTNITDAASLWSAFVYDTNQWVTALSTPYGTTTFGFMDNNLATNDAIDRAVLVVDPLGGADLYVSRYEASFLAGAAYTVPGGPAGAPSASSGAMTMRNTWHWGPMQYAQLSTTNMFSFTTNDYLKARQHNWLADSANSSAFSDALNMEQAVSPDGITPGLQRWRAYDGEAYPIQGSNAQPALLAWVLPDGNSYYQWVQRNAWGNVAAVVESYSVGFGTPALARTNTYTYGANGIDLVQAIGPLGETVTARSYDNHHNILAVTNAVGDVATYTYDAQSRLTSMTTPSGLTTTNLYFASGSDLTNCVQERIDLQIHRTNSYSYTNNLILVQTNELGLVTSNTWDNLQRLTSTTFPDGTRISNIYANLDLVQTIDQLGGSTSYGYDAIRHVTSLTNALGNVTQYHYCPCGALESIQDSLLNYTRFYYDIAGRRTHVVYPDGSSITNNYDPLGQITNSIDGGGISMTNWYNDQGRLHAASNSFGQLFALGFDIEDRVTNSTDANGVVSTHTYDLLGRICACTYPDGGVEHFGYSAFGLMAYTNQLTNVTYYGYDPAGRKIAKTNALGYVTQYAYDAGGHLTSLTDQKTNTTQWGYDACGRVTNMVDATSTSILQYQYDADNRLTNRWSVGKGNTSYAYDYAGNLTGMTYPSDGALSFGYNAMNWLTTMSDRIGTTVFTYTPMGQLASESGPWAGDMVSYAYSNQLRTVLALQQPNDADWIQTYGYDGAGRMNSVISPAGAFGYSYHPGVAPAGAASDLIAAITLPNGAWITNSYDANGRMLGTWLYNSSAAALDWSAYTYNAGNQRTSVQRSGENEADYAYDPIGQVTAEQAHEVSGGTARLNEQLHYAFDAAGNLACRTNNTLVENFQVNSLNELTANSNAGTLTVMGTATSSAASVTVNGVAATRYADATFVATNMSLTTTYTAVASDGDGRSSTNTVTVSLATNAGFQYDANGNLTNDGLRSFAYDDENQLAQVWVANQWLSQFSYDGKMRRRIRQEFAWQSGGWVQTNIVYYVYDGNLVIQERDADNLPLVTYTRGMDLSGSLEGSGGIGGLLARSMQSHAILPLAQSYYHADGNGNITMLISSNQAVVATYLYDAFGNTISKSGLLADANLYRFSSKEWDVNSGLAYYLFRYYDSHLQRWLNRDPLGELGFEIGRNVHGVRPRHPGLGSGLPSDLYGFVGNQAPNHIDIFGLLIDCKALEDAIDALYNKIQTYNDRGYRVPSLEVQVDKLERTYTRYCMNPPPPPPPATAPNSDPCPILVPTKPPPDSNNNNFHPPNLWPWVLRIGPLFLIPWPGNPLYGFL